MRSLSSPTRLRTRGPFLGLFPVSSGYEHSESSPPEALARTFLVSHASSSSPPFLGAILLKSALKREEEGHRNTRETDSKQARLTRERPSDVLSQSYRRGREGAKPMLGLLDIVLVYDRQVLVEKQPQKRSCKVGALVEAEF